MFSKIALDLGYTMQGLSAPTSHCEKMKYSSRILFTASEHHMYRCYISLN